MIWFLVAAVGPLLAPYTGTGNSRHLRRDVDPDNLSVLACVRALAEIILILGQHSLSEVSLTYLNKALKNFYDKKSVFRPYRMTDTRKAFLEKQ